MLIQLRKTENRWKTRAYRHWEVLSASPLPLRLGHGPQWRPESEPEPPLQLRQKHCICSDWHQLIPAPPLHLLRPRYAAQEQATPPWSVHYSAQLHRRIQNIPHCFPFNTPYYLLLLLKSTIFIHLYFYIHNIPHCFPKIYNIHWCCFSYPQYSSPFS